MRRSRTALRARLGACLGFLAIALAQAQAQQPPPPGAGRPPRNLGPEQRPPPPMQPLPPPMQPPPQFQPLPAPQPPRQFAPHPRPPPMPAEAAAMVSPGQFPAPMAPAPAAPAPSDPGPVQPWSAPQPDPGAAAPWGATRVPEDSQSPAAVADDAPPPGNANAIPDLAFPSTAASSEPVRLPRWLWLLAATCLLLLAGWRAAVKKSRVLSDETERLVRHQRQLQSAHSQLKSQSEHLRHLAINDPLTGTLNRQAFAGDLKQVLEHLARFRRPLNLMLFDLDHFKAINDGLGHLAGDKALRLVVGIVRQHLASEDLFGRFGGDEFLIACADQSIEDTAALAENIRLAVVREAAASDPPLTGLSLSIGIAQANPDTGYLPDVLFHRADTALYAAKNAGRNRVVLADDSLAPPPVIGAATRHLS